MGTSSKPSPPEEQTFISHLVELRDRLIRIIAVVVILFLVMMPFANDLYTWLAKPLLESLPDGATMIATQVASPFLTPFKFTFMLALFLCVPFILYQAWAFIAPGLYQSERRIVFPLLISSCGLFYLGVAFAYYLVFPVVFGFLTSNAPEGVSVMTDISSYLDFVLLMFFAFGIAFEVPIATVLVVWAGIATPESLAAKRRYIVVGAFVVGMLLTPPDVLSQTMLAIPMWLLFEVGLIASRRLVSHRDHEESDETAS